MAWSSYLRNLSSQNPWGSSDLTMASCFTLRDVVEEVKKHCGNFWKVLDDSTIEPHLNFGLKLIASDEQD